MDPSFLHVHIPLDLFLYNIEVFNVELLNNFILMFFLLQNSPPNILPRQGARDLPQSLTPQLVVVCIA
jgi:hypothetical protein